MNCPSCCVALDRKLVKEIEADECPECKGIWFEDDELRKAKDSTDSDLNWLDFEMWKHKDRFKVRPRGLGCPKCRDNLVAVDYGDTGVEIDYCPQCRGVWLDRGELDKIVERSMETMVPVSGVGEQVEPKRDEGRERKFTRKKKRGSFLEDLFDF